MLYCSLERYVASRCRSLLINVSEHDRQLGIQHRIADPKRLITIHNGVADIPYEWRANPAKQPPRLVMVARFAEQKDHETLLAALHHLKDKPWTLDLIGEGPKRAMITQSVADLGLAHRVRFFGECDDVAQQLAQAQLFLLISLWEGFPRSTLEAMRAGLPVIVSDVGGASEAIQEGKTGYVVARGNVAQLTDRLATLLDSPELRAQMGEAGRQRYAREYTLDHLFSRMMDVYQQVTKREETKEYALAA